MAGVDHGHLGRVSHAVRRPRDHEVLAGGLAGNVLALRVDLATGRGPGHRRLHGAAERALPGRGKGHRGARGEARGVGGYVEQRELPTAPPVPAMVPMRGLDIGIGEGIELQLPVDFDAGRIGDHEDAVGI